MKPFLLSKIMISKFKSSPKEEEEEEEDGEIILLNNKITKNEKYL